MTATCAPSWASAWQMRCPSPPLPPVTSATMPFRSIASLLSCECTVASLLTFFNTLPRLPFQQPLTIVAGDEAAVERAQERTLRAAEHVVDSVTHQHN